MDIKLVELVSCLGMKIAEIGVLEGDSSRYFAEIAKNNQGKAYLIDWFQGYPGHSSGMCPYSSKPRLDQIERVKRKLSGFEEYYELIISDSSSAAQKFPDEFFDFIFIDGDHSYLGVKTDLDMWWPKLKKGGIFSGHDFHKDHIELLKNNYTDDVLNGPISQEHHVGVAKAVIEKFGEAATKLEDDPWPGVWWVQK